MICFYFICSGISACEEWSDQKAGKYRFYTRTYSSYCKDDLTAGQVFDNNYKYISIDGLTNIPDNWISFAIELRTINSYSVTTIGANAFQNAPKLENVILTASGSNGIIGTNAFINLQYLRSVEIGGVFTTLQENCFSGCSNLETVKFHYSTYSLSLTTNAFANCYQLKSIFIGRSIYSSNFPGWTNLNQITVISNDLQQSNSIFSGCNSFFDLIIPTSVSSIKERAFSSWTNLRSVIILNTTNSLSFGNLPFENCNHLISLIIGRPISSSSFPGWTSLRQATINADNLRLYLSLFSACSTFPSFIFNSSVTSLTTGFQSWKSLQSVTFLDSSEPIIILKNAFINCDQLTSLRIGRSISATDFPGWINIERIIITSSDLNLPYVLFSNSSSLEIEFTSLSQSIIPNAFDSWTNLSSIVFHDATTPISIGNGAFNNCPKISTLSVGRSISSAEFPGWSALKTVTFTASLNKISIEHSLFENCELLTELSIGRPVESTEFPGWKNIQNITITSNYFALSYSLVSGCTTIPSLKFMPSVTSLNTKAFQS